MPCNWNGWTVGLLCRGTGSADLWPSCWRALRRVGALKDPLGANLDRIQIVKGWLDSKGETHEKVYDVVWSGDREPGAGGKVPAVGNTVDVANATWTNTIGGTELITVWADPDFDASLKAFYYARVIEIPTPRWTACAPMTRKSAP